MSAEEMSLDEVERYWRDVAERQVGSTRYWGLPALLAEYRRRGAELDRHWLGADYIVECTDPEHEERDRLAGQRAALLAACDQADQIPPDGGLMGAVSTSRIRELLAAVPLNELAHWAATGDDHGE